MATNSHKEKALKPPKHGQIRTATLIRGKEEEIISLLERRRVKQRSTVLDLLQRREITVVLGSPTAVMALNLFLVEKFQAHYV